MAYLSWQRQQNRNGYLVCIKEVAEARGVIGISDNTTKFNDLGLDSLDYIDFIGAIDDEFKVRIPDTDAAKFETVGDMIDWLEAA